MVLRFRWAGALAGALLAFSLPAQAADNTSTSIIVYSGKDASGDHMTLQQATPSLSGNALNDRITSAFVVSGKWELCTDKDYKGRCLTLNQGLTNLDSSMSNAVTSLRPVSTTQGAMLMFLDKDGGGKSLRATGEIKKMSEFPGFASAVSSIAIFKGNWELCKKNDFKGQCTTLGPGVYNLDSYNDYINSVRPK